MGSEPYRLEGLIKEVTRLLPRPIRDGLTIYGLETGGSTVLTLWSITPRIAGAEVSRGCPTSHFRIDSLRSLRPLTYDGSECGPRIL